MTAEPNYDRAPFQALHLRVAALHFTRKKVCSMCKMIFESVTGMARVCAECRPAAKRVRYRNMLQKIKVNGAAAKYRKKKADSMRKARAKMTPEQKAKKAAYQREWDRKKRERLREQRGQ